MEELEPSPEQARDYFKNKIMFTAGPVEVHRMLDTEENIKVIDVRAAKDFEKGHVPGAINLPENEWSSLGGLDKETVNVIYCYSVVCHLAARAAYQFASSGFRVVEMDGGMKEWQSHKLPIESGETARVNEGDYRTDTMRMA